MDQADNFLEAFERLLWNMLCRRQLLRGKMASNRVKRLAVLAYCLYYHGVTVPQIMMAGMSDSASESVVRMTMSKYATRDIRCCVMPKSRIADDVSGLPPVTSSDVKRPYFVHQVTYGRAKINVYELSEHGVSAAVYGLLDLPSEFLSGVNRQTIDLMVRRYRRHKSLCFSDEAMHMVSVRDVGAYCLRVLDFKPFVYRTECRFFENGSFLKEGTPRALASTAQICDGYVEFHPVTREHCDQQAVYVEQDMGTQSRGYLRKNKLIRYLDFVRYSFQRPPALVTLLFSFQTRVGFHVSGKKGAQADDSAGSRQRYAPALRQELVIRAYEAYGERWGDTLLSVFREKTEETMLACPAVRTHLKHELELFDSILSRNEFATISYCVDQVGAGNRTENGSFGKLEPRDRFYYKTRRLEIYEESQQIKGFKDMLLEGYSVMFAHNKSLYLTMPCLIPALSGVCPDTRTVFPMSVNTFRLCGFLARIYGFEIPFLDYQPFARSNERLFRNYYYNAKLSLHVVLENISDDLGGRARVMEYLANPSFSLFRGYLLCLVEDDWLDPLEEPVRKRRADFFYTQIIDSAYGGYLMDSLSAGADPFSMLPLRVIFVPYQAFLSGKTMEGVMELAAVNGGVDLVGWRAV